MKAIAALLVVVALATVGSAQAKDGARPAHAKAGADVVVASSDSIVKSETDSARARGLARGATPAPTQATAKDPYDVPLIRNARSLR